MNASPRATPTPQQVAYSDASVRIPGLAPGLRSGRHLAALGVVIGEVTHSRVQRVTSVAEAELRAAGLAVILAAPGHLTLHVDCALSAALLDDPRGPHRLVPLAQAIHEAAVARGVEFTVVRVPGERNPAHAVAYGRLQAELAERRARFGDRR
ncbi:hypothetical protein [Deinococcus frigens]|uniref:hypothetical protein n=1 Tax=Deinococcus frigens TaxID=249403 RepID=UPI000498033D|nr:hypothetical protein [Deinococcus frigens]